MAKIKNQTIVVIGGKEPVLQEKSVEITENTTTTITADEGFDGLKSLEVITNIAGSGGNEELLVGLFSGDYTGELETPSNITIIRSYAVADFDGLSKLKVTNNIISILGYAFARTSNLETFIYDGNVPRTKYTSSRTMFYYAGKAGSRFIIGSNTGVIPNYFLSTSDASYMPKFTRIYNEPRNKDLVIGNYQNGSTSIYNNTMVKIWLDDFGVGKLTLGQNAFRNFNYLYKVCLNAPSIIGESIGAFGVAGNSSFGMVFKFGEAVQSIGINILSAANVNNLYVGSNVTSIGSKAFNITSTLLKAITINCETPPTIQSDTFATSEAPIYIPKGRLDAYTNATNWSALASRFVELEYTNYTDGTNTLTLGNNLWFDAVLGGTTYNGTYTLTDGALELDVFDKELGATYTGTITDNVASVTINGTTYTLTLEA